MSVLLIQPPYMQLSEPDYSIPDSLKNGVRYLNPALLIQGSYLQKKDVSTSIIVCENINNLCDIDDYLRRNKVCLVGISCTSAWEYLETLHIAAHIKKHHDIPIVVGGWQIKSIQQKIFQDSNNIDYIIVSDSDTSMYDLYNVVSNKGALEYTSGIFTKHRGLPYDGNNSLLESFDYNFAMYPNYATYIPFVEESRGCPYSCKFCLNSCIRQCYATKSIERFEKDILNLKKFYGINFEAVLLASNFGVNAEKTRQKLRLLADHNIFWNLELHADNPWEHYIDLLYDAGVRKVSIGLESCSEKILKAMNKTKNPKKYLNRVSELLKQLHANKIRTTVNILFHFEDNHKTMNETLYFLIKNQNVIDRVRFNIMYLFDGLRSNYDGIDFKRYAIYSDFNEKLHLTPLTPDGFDSKKLISFFDTFEEIYNKRNVKIET